ncbi:MAG: HAD-IA family hydrolase, partial [Thermoplasmata archaeon]|nr:HAD-IA family hydrolase [Thermoplasmata archaeon]
LLVAERMGVEPKACVNIDDAPKGVMGAKNAGMKAIAIPTKDTQFGDFDEADIVLPNLDEVTAELVRMI